MTALHPRCEEVLDFWFGDLRTRVDDLELLRARTRMWFFKDPALDERIRERFAEDVRRARAGEYAAWSATPRGTLGLVVLLDQFPRNLHRGEAEAFASDAAALALVDAALGTGADGELVPGERFVLYLPVMHAEDAGRQEQVCSLYRRLAADAPPAVRSEIENGVRAAEKHREVIARFGRFPQRNAALGRQNTDEEAAFLATPNAAF